MTFFYTFFARGSGKRVTAVTVALSFRWTISSLICRVFSGARVDSSARVCSGPVVIVSVVAK